MAEEVRCQVVVGRWPGAYVDRTYTCNAIIPRLDGPCVRCGHSHECWCGGERDPDVEAAICCDCDKEQRFAFMTHRYLGPLANECLNGHQQPVEVKP